ERVVARAQPAERVDAAGIAGGVETDDLAEVIGTGQVNDRAGFSIVARGGAEAIVQIVIAVNRAGDGDRLHGADLLGRTGLVHRATVIAVAAVGGMPGVGAGLGRRYCRRSVGSSAGDDDRAH